ncbi:MAG: DNA polymerase I [Bacilli bacterium]|nr:DNA polymerase I [Bacilli bacterium]
MKKAVLIDGNSLMFRAFYATFYGNVMKTSSGLYTNAIYGFINMMNKILESEFDYIFVAFDAGKETFRHQRLDSYKANRKKMPEELAMQIDYIKEYLDILNIKRLEMKEYEADDLLAIASKNIYDSVDEIEILTADRDLLQLVNGKIKVSLTKKGITELLTYDSNNFYELSGLNPNQVTDYKGLVGDTSDNLPGIKGIGEKTAIKLLTEFGSLENIYNNLDKLSDKNKQLFLDNKEISFECKSLATLITDNKNILSLKEIEKQIPDFEKLNKFFRNLEFNSFLKKLDMPLVKEAEIEYEIISKIDYDFSFLNQDGIIETEVFGNNYYTAHFLGLGLISGSKSMFIEKEVVVNSKSLKTYLENEKYKKKTFNFKKTYVVLKRFGIELNGLDFDLLLDTYLLNPDNASDDIKNIADKYNLACDCYTDEIYGAGKKALIPLVNIYSKYALRKCIIIKSLEKEIKNDLSKVSLDLLRDIEYYLSKVLGDMEISGLLLNKKKLVLIGEDLEKRAEIISKEIYKKVGYEFNISSPKQLAKALFEDMRLPTGKKIKTGFSTDSKVLEQLSLEGHSIASDILEYRTLMKINSTYVLGLLDLIDQDSYIHPLYKQALTTTGRLSSFDPNIQNMPIRTETGQVIREAFVSRFVNGSIISADYSQIELRIVAHLSSDENMIKMFKDGKDIHTITASQIFEVALDAVDSSMRRTAKAINFGIIYGISAWGLSGNINISPKDADIYIKKYFANFPKVKEFLDKVVLDAKTNGYTKTLFNRRRYISEINSSNKMLKEASERTAMNAPVQGTAADIIKIAMNLVHSELKKKGLNTILIAQVHDELLLDAPSDEVEEVKVLVKKIMENAVSLSVPLTVEVSSGKTWLAAK